MSHLEWFPTYPARFLQSRRVRAMNLEEVGAYQLLLCEQWRDGAIPDDDPIIGGLCKQEPSIARAVLERCFTLTNEGWINPELLVIQGEQEKKHQQKVEAGRLGGQAPLKQNPPRVKNKEKAVGARVRARALSEDWEPNETHQKISLEEGVQFLREAEKFRSHALANNRKQVDWDQAFCNWLRKAGDFRQQDSPGIKSDPVRNRL